MGGSTSKQDGKHKKNLGRRSTRLAREVIDDRKYDRDMMVFGLKEVETKWRKERKRLKEEVKRLRKKVEEKEERVREMVVGGKCRDAEVGLELVVEQMSVERAVRDEAVERWKQLYLAIKTELDHLIQMTHGERLYGKTEEEDMTMMMEELKKELKVKEGIIERLEERIASTEREKYVKEREIDILRQSLRIISSSSSNKTQRRRRRRIIGHCLLSRTFPVCTNKCIGSK